MFAGREHHAGVCMPRLVRLAIPDAAAFERPRPQGFADRLIAGPPLSGLGSLEHLGALEQGVLRRVLQSLTGSGMACLVWLPVASAA